MTNARASSASEMLQCLRRLPNSFQLLSAINRIVNAYKSDAEPWVVGYSGGKDSTALVKLIFQSLLRIEERQRHVTVIYCDTGVEIPLASTLARNALIGLEAEARGFDLPISVRILSPLITERFFVKVIGRGFPPPTDKFRWCTDRLRIDPVSDFLASEHVNSATVVLGVRESESATRKLTLIENGTDDRFWKTQRGARNRRLFMPILDYSIQDVWLANLLVDRPRALRAKDVAELYASASGECPTVRDVKGAPCGKARFGCWTCTVAKNGVTLRNLIASGNDSLKPLLRFRLWMEKERNNPRYRWPKRRNGRSGLGPMTLTWRRMALRRLLKAQHESGLQLIDSDELSEIQREWDRDDVSELHKARWTFPYFIFLACLVPIFVLPSKSLNEADLRIKVIATVAALLLCAAYVGLGIRKSRWKREMNRYVGKQIRASLLDMIPTDLEVTADERSQLGDTQIYQALTGVFWEAIDRNELLKSHKEHFYANGVIYSTAIDVYLICGFAGFCYAVAAVLGSDTSLACTAAVLLLSAIVSIAFALPRARRDHLKLSAEQLDLLRREQGDFVSKRYREIVVGWRRRS